MGEYRSLYFTLGEREKMIADLLSDDDPNPDGKTKEELENYISPLHPEYMPAQKTESLDYISICKDKKEMALIYLEIALKDYLAVKKYGETESLETSRSCYKEALAYFVELNDVLGQAHVHLGLGEVAILKQNKADIETNLKNAIIFFENLGKHDFAAYARELLVKN